MSRQCVAALLCLVGVGLLLGSAGCASGGKLLMALGLVQGKKIDAKFNLTQGPLLIFVDDPEEYVDWPVAIRMLTEAMGRELKKNEAASIIVPYETLQTIRQSDPHFSTRSIREIGEQAGAEQVIYMKVEVFQASEKLYELTDAGVYAVSIKVINVKEKEQRSKVRVWPPSPAGYYVSSTLSAGEVEKFKTRDLITQALSQFLAEKAAKLFYDYRLEEFDEEV